jgi:uncharacterized protein (TIGR04255 family)
MSNDTPRASTEATIGRPTDLPDFESPPISEVILSIQFATIDKMKSAHVGLLWARLRPEYPDVTEQATIGAVFETFGTTPQAGAPMVQFEQFLSPPMPRYWFERSGTPDLLQVQQDRIIHNWRKQEDEQIYPRYETLRERFRSEVEQFTAFLKEENLGELRPNQCEVTYTNAIVIPGSERAHDRLEEITPLWTGRFNEGLDVDPENAKLRLEGELENAAVQMRFKLLESEKPVGRIHISFQPGHLRSDPSKQVVKLDITARGRPKQETTDSAFEFFDFGRRAVVKMFAAVTTPSMHTKWGQTNAGN